jgi:hypothetical protein
MSLLSWTALDKRASQAKEKKGEKGRREEEEKEGQ